MQTTLINSANLFRLVHFFDILAAVAFLVTFGVRSLAIKFGSSLPVFREPTKRERWRSDPKDSAED